MPAGGEIRTASRIKVLVGDQLVPQPLLRPHPHALDHGAEKRQQMFTGRLALGLDPNGVPAEPVLKAAAE